MKKITGFSLIMLFLSSLYTPVFADDIENVIGFGVGLPYGGFGINYELGLTDYFAPMIGVGALPDNVGWNVGARLYYPDRSAKFRVRATCLYGTNTLLEERSWWNNEEEYTTDEGISAGFGFNWRFAQSWAFDFDLFYVDSDIPAGYEEKGSDVKFALGFSCRW